MARQESDREDLLAEATALVERVEMSIPEFPELVVAGFRRDGSLSVFFGGDPVYQFNSRHELRRAFVAGLLYKADDGRLASLDRVRTAEETQLVRHDLTDAESAQFVSNASALINSLAAALERGAQQIVRQVPPDIDIVVRMLAALQPLRSQLSIARTLR
jgi:hypothetical protein